MTQPIRNNIVLNNGETYCSHCRRYQSSAGGKHIKTANGLRQRWKCAGCLKSIEKSEGKAA